MSGVRVRSVKLVAYVLGGLLAALGGMYMAISMASGSPTVGDGYILTSIAAVVIGGVPLTGGRGSPIARCDGRADPDDHREPALFRRRLVLLPEPDRWRHPACGGRQFRRRATCSKGWCADDRQRHPDRTRRTVARAACR